MKSIQSQGLRILVVILVLGVVNYGMSMFPEINQTGAEGSGATLFALTTLMYMALTIADLKDSVAALESKVLALTSGSQSES